MCYETSNNNNTETAISIAFVGNSILYYNDCPRLLEQLLQCSYPKVTQESCLCGGASLPTLARRGGDAHVFDNPNGKNRNEKSSASSTVKELVQSRPWDYVVLQDHTQAPCRDATREETKQVLKSYYAPLLVSNQVVDTSVVVLLQTATYRSPGTNNSQDLGDTLEFYTKLQEGYKEYATVLNGEGVSTRIAPVGAAFEFVRQHNLRLWTMLYDKDDVHYSPHGTWLQACVLYCTIVQQVPPPRYNPDWFTSCRRMQPPSQASMPLPTELEANELRDVAVRVCDLFIR
jgi:hypothetical protein